MLVRAISKFKFEEILHSYPSYYKEFLASFEKKALSADQLRSDRSMGFGLLGSISDNRESVSKRTSSKSGSELESQGSNEDDMNVAKEEYMIVNLNVSTNSELTLMKDTHTNEKIPHMSAVLLDNDQSRTSKYADKF